MVCCWFNGMECDRLCFHLPDMKPGSGGSDREGEEGEEETQRVRVRGGEGGSELSSAVVIWIQN